jgi:hypothetical protein
MRRCLKRISWLRERVMCNQTDQIAHAPSRDIGIKLATILHHPSSSKQPYPQHPSIPKNPALATPRLSPEQYRHQENPVLHPTTQNLLLSTQI